MVNAAFDLFHLDEEVSQQLHNTNQSYVDMDYMKIMEYDAEYSEALMDNPQYELNYLSRMASGFANRNINIQLHNIPITMDIHQIKRQHMYGLIQVVGTVMQRSEKKSRPTTLVYLCPICSEEIEIEQTEQWRIAPEKCECDNRKGFSKLYEKTVFDDCQWLEIQEFTDNTKMSDTQAKIRVMVRNHLIDACTPGENVIIVGIPKVLESRPNTLNLDMVMYLDCCGLTNDTEEETINLSQEDIGMLTALVADPEHLQNVIKSFAPTVYGEEIVKEALAYQQCEGVVRQLTRKKRRRGQIHILLAGPPGVAKSDLGEYQMLYHHKGRMATGRGASSVGLTASVVQENGEWVLKVGAMPLADNGLLFIDEIEKMRPEDSGAMHPGMEAQQIPISKAGINATIKTRCSIIAACNPIGGKWIDGKGLLGNLIEKGKGLTTPLLNRFALIFIVREKETEEEESLVVDHILKISTDFESMTVPYSEETLRKLFIYARTFKPTLTDEAAEKLKEFYLTLFKASKGQEGIIMSRRQIEDLVRLSEASAKLNLRDTVTVGDAENAIRLLAESLKQYAINPITGEYDQAAAFYGQPTTVTARIRQLPEIVKRVIKQNPGRPHANRVQLVEYTCNLWKEKEVYVEKLLTVALRDGLLYCPLPGMLGVAA